MSEEDLPPTGTKIHSVKVRVFSRDFTHKYRYAFFVSLSYSHPQRFLVSSISLF